MERTPSFSNKISVKFDEDGLIQNVAGLENHHTPPWKIDNSEMELDMIKQKYETKEKSIRENRIKRRASQLNKLDQIIKDAADLYEIIDNTGKWI